jgi:hypothetical protein
MLGEKSNTSADDQPVVLLWVFWLVILCNFRKTFFLCMDRILHITAEIL